MSTAACLLLYAITFAGLAPPLLTRLTRSGADPRLAVAVWLTAIGSVTGSVAAAATLLGAELFRDWSRPRPTVMAACLAWLRTAATGAYGPMARTVVFTLAGWATLATILLLFRLGRTWARARRSTLTHAGMVRLAGVPHPDLGAVVLDVPDRAVYCVAGRQNTIVFTTGALAALDPTQLGAVLAHERAHLSGRHHLLLALTRGLHTCLPCVELFTRAAAEVARLLEMCADDTAVRTHGRGPLLTALVDLSGASHARIPIPTAGLAASGVDVLARAERLATPAGSEVRLRARVRLAAALTGFTAAPLVVGALAVCGPLLG